MAAPVRQDKYVRNLAASSYPIPEDVPDARDVFLRRWVLRTVQMVDEVSILQEFCATTAAHVARVLSASFDPEMVRRVALDSFLIDEHHIVLEIVCPRHEVADGDVAGSATFMVLQAADRKWGVEDLQGIPRRFWFALAGSEPHGD